MNAIIILIKLRDSILDSARTAQGRINQAESENSAKTSSGTWQQLGIEQGKHTAYLHLSELVLDRIRLMVSDWDEREVD